MFSVAELQTLQAMSDSAMPDTGTVKRPGDTAGTLNPLTGVFTPADSTTIYTGPLRIKAATAQDITAIFGDQQVTSIRYIGVLPHDAPAVQIDDTINVTASSDPQVATETFRVRAVSHGSYLFDRRLALEIVE